MSRSAPKAKPTASVRHNGKPAGPASGWIAHVQAYRSAHGCSLKEAMQGASKTWKGASKTYRNPHINLGSFDSLCTLNSLNDDILSVVCKSSALQGLMQKLGRPSLLQESCSRLRETIKNCLSSLHEGNYKRVISNLDTLKTQLKAAGGYKHVFVAIPGCINDPRARLNIIDAIELHLGVLRKAVATTTPGYHANI